MRVNIQQRATQMATSIQVEDLDRPKGALRHELDVLLGISVLLGIISTSIASTRQVCRPLGTSPGWALARWVAGLAVEDG